MANPGNEPYIGEIAELLRARVSAIKGRPTKTDRSLLLVYAFMVKCLGTETTIEDVHDGWAAWAEEHKPGDPNIVPARQLSRAVLDQDLPYLQAIHDVARELGSAT